MFHPPKMLPVLLGHLVVQGAIIEDGNATKKRKTSWFMIFVTVQTYSHFEQKMFVTKKAYILCFLC